MCVCCVHMRDVILLMWCCHILKLCTHEYNTEFRVYAPAHTRHTIKHSFMSSTKWAHPNKCARTCTIHTQTAMHCYAASSLLNANGISSKINTCNLHSMSFYYMNPSPPSCSAPQICRWRRRITKHFSLKFVQLEPKSCESKRKENFPSLTITTHIVNWESVYLWQ